MGTVVRPTADILTHRKTGPRIVDPFGIGARQDVMRN